MIKLKTFTYIFSLSLFLTACGLKGGHNEVEGDLNKVLKANSKDIDACRRSFEKKNPSRKLENIIVVAQIVSSGAVYEVNPREVFPGGDSLYQCLAKKMMNWQFDRTGGREVTYTITIRFPEAQ